jgi:hypothetical protein
MSLSLLLTLSAAAGAVTTSSVQLAAFDASGRPLDLPALVEYIGRADKRGGPPLWVWSPDGATGRRPTLSQRGKDVVLSWPDLPHATLSLAWPVPEDGFSTVLVDREGRGLRAGDSIRLNEEIALTQYRLFKEAWGSHVNETKPAYKPSEKAKKLYDGARAAVAKAEGGKDTAERAKLFDRALHEISMAWQKLLVEHGQQLAANSDTRANIRFGLTLDSSLLDRLADVGWIVDAVQRSGSNWVRLVFRPNPDDFVYAKQRSLSEYDSVVKTLRAKNIRVLGCVLDTGQWPSSLTPPVYVERARNLVLHYKGQINSWELGNEINGDWLGGARAPLSPDAVLQIYSAAAEEVRRIEPSLEIVATLYWWEGTAPDEIHSLFGWLKKYGSRLARHVDTVAVSLQVDDNPVGLSLERIFQQLHQALPDKRLMIGNVGYVEGSQLRGFWWLDPKDIDGARKDLLTLLTPGAAALPRSVGGGFWWQTLDQMLPVKHKATDLYKVYKRTIDGL